MKRIIITRADPCGGPGEKREAEHIIINSLLLSHAIRIDTRLYLIAAGRERRRATALDGETLRHLYPQRRSLRGFINKILCRGRAAPGIIYGDAPPSKVDVAIVSAPGSREQYYEAISKLASMNPRLVAITPDQTLWSGEAAQTIKLSIRHPPYFIAVSHYIIDQALGYSIRRRGRILYA